MDWCRVLSDSLCFIMNKLDMLKGYTVTSRLKTSLNISRQRREPCTYGAEWKYYLPATSLARGNNYYLVRVGIYFMEFVWTGCTCVIWSLRQDPISTNCTLFRDALKSIGNFTPQSKFSNCNRILGRSHIGIIIKLCTPPSHTHHGTNLMPLVFTEGDTLTPPPPDPPLVYGTCWYQMENIDKQQP